MAGFFLIAYHTIATLRYSRSNHFCLMPCRPIRATCCAAKLSRQSLRQGAHNGTCKSSRQSFEGVPPCCPRCADRLLAAASPGPRWSHHAAQPTHGTESKRAAVARDGQEFCSSCRAGQASISSSHGTNHLSGLVCERAPSAAKSNSLRSARCEALTFCIAAKTVSKRPGHSLFHW